MSAGGENRPGGVVSGILEPHAVRRVHGGLTAVRELSFEVAEDEMRGRNGAGKATTFNVICGFPPP